MQRKYSDHILEPMRKILREFLLNQAAISAVVLTIAPQRPVHDAMQFVSYDSFILLCRNQKDNL